MTPPGEGSTEAMTDDNLIDAVLPAYLECWQREHDHRKNIGTVIAELRRLRDERQSKGNHDDRGTIQASGEGTGMDGVRG